jgi:hypothetical protein
MQGGCIVSTTLATAPSVERFALLVGVFGGVRSLDLGLVDRGKAVAPP